MAKQKKDFIESDNDYRLKLASSENSEVPATKEFVINATGNFFIASTINGGDPKNADISDEAKKAFGQVSAFFAAVTKAMSEEEKSLYDFEAIDRLVSNSGLFVKVTESKILFKSSSWGIKFGNELIQTLFGLSGNLASIGKSLTDMIAGMGKEGLEIKNDKQKTNKKVGTIIFVCEYLLGMVSITPIVISVDTVESKKVFEAGPCFNFDAGEQEINIVKGIYMFVPPAFIEHAAKLNKAMADEEFTDLVENIKSAIRKPTDSKSTSSSTSDSTT